MLDATNFQAVMLLESYISKSSTQKLKSVNLPEISLVCLALAIKNNEDSILSYSDCIKLLNEKRDTSSCEVHPD